MPALSCVALAYYSGFQLGQYSPFYTDELHYWNEISTLVTVGLHGGYSVINEMPSATDWSRFGPHGPGFPLVVSPFAWSFGWSTHSPVIFNMAWLSIALLIYFQSVPLNRVQRVSVAAFVSSFSPVLMFLPTAMQESLHQGIGVLIAAMIVRRATQALSESEKAGRIRDLAVAAMFAAFAFIRASWGMIYVLSVAIVPGRGGSLLHHRLLLGLAMLLLTFWFMQNFNSPATRINAFELLLQAVFELSPEKLGHYLDIAANNARGFFAVSSGHNSVAMILRYQALILLVYCVYRLIPWKAGGVSAASVQTIRFCLLLLLATTLLLVLFYEVGSWKDYRILAPSVIAATLAIASTDRRAWIVWVMVVIQLVALPQFSETFRLFRQPNFQQPTPAQMHIEDTLKQEVRYAPNSNPWCNTLLLFTPGRYEDADVASVWRVNPGIGVSLLMDTGSFDFPIRSRYVFLTPEAIEHMREADIDLTELMPLADFGDTGVLFENSAADCAATANVARNADIGCRAAGDVKLAGCDRNS